MSSSADRGYLAMVNCTSPEEAMNLSSVPYMKLYYENLKEACNDDPYEFPVFCRLSPQQRMYDVAQVTTALLCQSTPLPEDTIGNKNTKAAGFMDDVNLPELEALTLETQRKGLELEVTARKAVKAARRAMKDVSDADLESTLASQLPTPSIRPNSQQSVITEHQSRLTYAAERFLSHRAVRASKTFSKTAVPHPAADLSRELTDNAEHLFETRRLCVQTIRALVFKQYFPCHGVIRIAIPGRTLLSTADDPEAKPEQSILMRRTTQKLRTEFESKWTPELTIWSEKLTAALTFEPSEIARFVSFIENCEKIPEKYISSLGLGKITFLEIQAALKGWKWIHEFDQQLQEGKLANYDARLKLFTRLVRNPPGVVAAGSGSVKYVPLMMTLMQGMGAMCNPKSTPKDYVYEEDEIRCFGCNETQQDDTKFKSCGACGMVRYCSPLCQKQDWPKHKADCLYFRSKK
ncbi:hypothetical protein HDU79_009447 [Rhizoclosmatium sp. JEL0117]|nr:hypothetical protein HDU79_009447 [Rhizoclosmatium sp. JEL0117]